MDPRKRIVNRRPERLHVGVTAICTLWLVMSTFAAAQTIEGRVTGAGGANFQVGGHTLVSEYERAKAACANPKQ